MTVKKTKKLCWNCEGEVERDAILCRFCGVNVLHVVPIELHQQPAIPLPPYAVHEESSDEENVAEADGAAQDDKEADGPPRLSLSALLFSTLGTFFLLFALVLILFSDKGVLTLKWKASYWLVYLLAAFPLLFFGWKLAKAPEERL